MSTQKIMGIVILFRRLCSYIHTHGILSEQSLQLLIIPAGRPGVESSIYPSIHWPQDRRGQDGISGITKPSAYICNQCKKIVIGSRPDIQQQQKVPRTTHRGSHLVPHKHHQQHHHQHQSTATRPARTVVNLTRKGTISLSLSTYTLLLLITTPK